MQKREKVLAALAGLMLVGVGAVYGLGQFRSLYTSRERKIEQLDKDLFQQELAIRRAQRAAAELTEWEQRSLPTDLTVAQALYQQWLLDLVRKSKLSGSHVDCTFRDPGQSKQTKPYQVVPFSVRGRGKLEQLSLFLQEFYTAPHLHQVRRITIKPSDVKGEQEFLLAIEACALPGADRKESLSTAKLEPRLPDEWDSLRTILAQREPFAPYVPPAPRRPPPPPAVVRNDPPPTPPAPKPPSFDASKFAVVTAILAVDDLPQVWIIDRTTGRTHKLSQGDAVEIGALRGRIGTITERSVIVESTSGNRRVGLGEPVGGPASGAPGI